jgi:hypothetical protein
MSVDLCVFCCINAGLNYFVPACKKNFPVTLAKTIEVQVEDD